MNGVYSVSGVSGVNSVSGVSGVNSVSGTNNFIALKKLPDTQKDTKPPITIDFVARTPIFL